MEYRSPVCKARICRKSPLMFQHPSFILARRTNRHHFRVCSRVMPMPPGYTKVFGFAPTWCTKKSRNECCGFFVAPFPPGRTHTSRKRSCSSRGDWSLNSVRRTEFLTRPLMVHQKKPQRMLRLFCCTIPFGTDSHFAQALVFVSRGLVAKNGCGFVSRGHD